MNLSISNIAWDKKNDVSVANILNHNKISHIDIAPTIYQEIIKNYKISKFKSVKNFWKEFSIEFHSMQSLFYGLDKFSIFDQQNHTLLLDHLKKNIEIAEVLGIKNLIFGSPKIRRYLDKENSLNQEIALNFFNKAADALEGTNCILSIEPNPIEYGSEFIINSKECIEFVYSLSRDKVRVHLDLGSLKLTEENLYELLVSGEDMINSIHISEPFLEIINDLEFHNRCSQIIKEKYKLKMLNIEIASKNILSLKELENNIKTVKDIYG